jgi:hypothetical protein
MSPPSPSAPDACTQAFHVLTSNQIDRIRPLGYIQIVQSGETLMNRTLLTRPRMSNSELIVFRCPNGIRSTFDSLTKAKE